MNYNEGLIDRDEIATIAFRSATLALETEFDCLETEDAENMLQRLALQMETTYTAVLMACLKVKDPLWAILFGLKYECLDMSERLNYGGVLFIRSRAGHWEAAYVKGKTFDADGPDQQYLPIDKHLLLPIIPYWRKFHA